MSDTLCEIEVLRESIAERLSGLADFNGIDVLTRKVGNLQNAIVTNLAQLKGVCVVVFIPSAIPKAYQTTRPFLDPVKVVVRTIEDTLFNKTGKSACLLATRAQAALQLWKPPHSFCHQLVPDEGGMMELNLVGKIDEESADKEGNYSGWDVHFTTKLAIQPAQ